MFALEISVNGQHRVTAGVPRWLALTANLGAERHGECDDPRMNMSVFAVGLDPDGRPGPTLGSPFESSRETSLRFGRSRQQKLIRPRPMHLALVQDCWVTMARFRPKGTTPSDKWMQMTISSSPVGH